MPRTALRTASVALASSLLLVASACSDGENFPGTGCDSSVDCAEGQTCIERICVDDEVDAGADVDGAPEDTDPTDAPAGDAGRDIPPPDDTDAAPDSNGVDETVDEPIDYGPLTFVVEPGPGAEFVPLDASIVVRFNQPMNALRFIPSNLTLSPLHADPLDRLLEYDDVTYSLTIAPTPEMPTMRPVTPHIFRMSEFIAAASGETLGEAWRMEFSTTGYPGRAFPRALAEAYAPVIYQQVEEASIDTFTRVDFDDDLLPANNLSNAVAANYGYVYYDVLESVTHWFVTYMIYYPGSHPREDVTFEHDIVGVQVLVEKTADDPLGRLRAFSTIYHENLNLWAVESGWYPEGEDIGSPVEGIAGRLPADMVEGDRHVSIFVESGRHGVCLPNASTLAGPCAPTGGDTAPFEDDTVGVVYRVAEAALRIGDAPNDALTYSLRSFVEELWQFRNRVGGDDGVYGGEYEYAPPVISEEFLRPGEGELFPTAFLSEHGEGSFGDLPFIFNATRERADQGVWFVDPAWALNELFSLPESFSQDYCFNPFLDIDERDERRGCTPTDFELGE